MASGLDNVIDQSGPIARGAAIGLQANRLQQQLQQQAAAQANREAALQQKDEALALRERLGMAALDQRAAELDAKHQDVLSKLFGAQQQAEGDTAVARSVGMFAGEPSYGEGGMGPPAETEDPAAASAFQSASPQTRQSVLQSWLTTGRQERAAATKSKIQEDRDQRRLDEIAGAHNALDRIIKDHPDMEHDDSVKVRRAALRVMEAESGPKAIGLGSAESLVRAARAQHPQVLADHEEAADFVIAHRGGLVNQMPAPGTGVPAYKPELDPMYRQLNDNVEMLKKDYEIAKQVAGRLLAPKYAQEAEAARAKLTDAQTELYDYLARRQSTVGAMSKPGPGPVPAPAPAAAPGPSPLPDASNPLNAAAAKLGLTPDHLQLIAQMKAQGVAPEAIAQKIRELLAQPAQPPGLP